MSNKFGLFLIEYFRQSKSQTVFTPISSLNEATSYSRVALTYLFLAPIKRSTSSLILTFNAYWL